MAVLVIGILAALLIGVSVDVALYIEVRALRGVLLHAKKTQQRIGLVEREREENRYRDKGAVRVAEAADAIKRRRVKQRELAASEVPATIGNDAAEEEDDDKTNVWTSHDAARMRVEAEAGGATRRPSATPREALSVAVAPPASAPPPTSPESSILAAGLGRPRSARPAPHAPPVRVRTETLAGMPSPLLAPEASDASERTSRPGLKSGGGVGMSTRPPPGPAPAIAIPRFAPTLASMQAQSAPPASASRSVSTLAFSDLIGRDDIPEEALLHLGPEDKTPPRRGRSALLVPVFRDPGAGEGGAA